MSVWCHSKEEFLTLSKGALEQMQALCEPGLFELEQIGGYCRICRRQTTFKLGTPPPGEWTNLREGLVCECGMNSRMRMIVKVLEELPVSASSGFNVVLERVTPLFPHLEARFPGLIGCEYLGPDLPAGKTTDVNNLAVRNENMMQLTFADESVNLLMHFDVLEHVPDARAGLREAWRVLSEHGRMVFTCPFFHQLEEDIVRARPTPDGGIEYLMEKAYHGNPMSGEGSLVYIHPSLRLFDMLQEAGFRNVGAVISYDPIEGIFSNGCPFPDGHMWPITFVVGK